SFVLRSTWPILANCAYCSHEIVAGAIGCSTTRHFHAPEAAALKRVRPDHLVFFANADAARAAGYSASSPAAGESSPPAAGSQSPQAGAQGGLGQPAGTDS
ncbi:MAG: hypothetical protein AAF368_15360, partial [Planctomycetota bacterium]